MKHFINLKDIPAKDLRRILIDAKKRKKARKNLNNLDHDKGMPLKGKLLIQMLEILNLDYLQKKNYLKKSKIYLKI